VERLKRAKESPETTSSILQEVIDFQAQYEEEDAKLLRLSMKRHGLTSAVIAAVNQYGGIAEPVAARGSRLLATMARDEDILKEMREAGMGPRARTLTKRHPESFDVQMAASALHAAIRGVWQLHECATRIPVPPMDDEELRMWLPHTFGKYVRRRHHEGKAVPDHAIRNAHELQFKAQLDADQGTRGSMGRVGGRPRMAQMREVGLGNEHTGVAFEAWRRSKLGRSFSQELVTVGGGYDEGVEYHEKQPAATETKRTKTRRGSQVMVAFHAAAAAATKKPQGLLSPAEDPPLSSDRRQHEESSSTRRPQDEVMSAIMKDPMLRPAGLTARSRGSDDPFHTAREGEKRGRKRFRDPLVKRWHAIAYDAGPVGPARNRFDTELLLLSLQHYREDPDALTVILSTLSSAIGVGPKADEGFASLRRNVEMSLDPRGANEEAARRDFIAGIKRPGTASIGDVARALAERSRTDLPALTGRSAVSSLARQSQGTHPREEEAAPVEDLSKPPPPPHEMQGSMFFQDFAVAELPLLCHALLSPLDRHRGHASLQHYTAKVVSALARSTLLCSELGRQGALSYMAAIARSFPDPLPRDTEQQGLWALSELCRHPDNVALFRAGEGVVILREVASRGAAELIDFRRLKRAEEMRRKANKVLGLTESDGKDDGSTTLAVTEEAERALRGGGGMSSAGAATASIADALKAGTPIASTAIAPVPEHSKVVINARSRANLLSRQSHSRGGDAGKKRVVWGQRKATPNKSRRVVDDPEEEDVVDDSEAALRQAEVTTTMVRGVRVAKTAPPKEKTGEAKVVKPTTEVDEFLMAGLEPTDDHRPFAHEVNAAAHKGILALPTIGTMTPHRPTFGPGYYEDEPLPENMPPRPPPLSIPLRLRDLFHVWVLEDERDRAEAAARRQQEQALASARSSRRRRSSSSRPEGDLTARTRTSSVGGKVSLLGGGEVDVTESVGMRSSRETARERSSRLAESMRQRVARSDQEAQATWGMYAGASAQLIPEDERLTGRPSSRASRQR
jgi:hypothetical protein